MPGVRPVARLQDLCLARFSTHLADLSIDPNLSAERAREDAGEAIAYLQKSVPKVFFEGLVHTSLAVMNNYFYQPKHKSRRPCMVAVVTWLLGDHMRHLSLDTCRMLCDRLSVPHVFACLARTPRLETLAIGRLNFWKIPELNTLPNILTGLPHLTSLRLEYICLPEMLTNLADKCPRLRELSVKDSTKIGDSEVAEIVRCRRLESLDISGTSITSIGSWKILSALTDLISFEHCPFNCKSSQFLFHSKDDVLHYIWDLMGPKGQDDSSSSSSAAQKIVQPGPENAPSSEEEPLETRQVSQGSQAVHGDAPMDQSGPSDVHVAPLAEEENCAEHASLAVAHTMAPIQKDAEIPVLSNDASSNDDARGVYGAPLSKVARLSLEDTASAERDASSGSDELKSKGRDHRQGNSTFKDGGHVEGRVDNRVQQANKTEDLHSNDCAQTQSNDAIEESVVAAASLNDTSPSLRESSAGPGQSSSHFISGHMLSLTESRVETEGGQARPLRIENFWLFNPSADEFLLARLCPEVRRLRLDFAFEDVGTSPDFNNLSLFKHVTRLDLSSFDVPRLSVISEIIRRTGAELSSLSLHICDSYAISAALDTTVAQSCPKLEEYSFTGDFRDPRARGDDELDFSVGCRHQKLKSLRLGGFVTGRRLLFLLAHASSIRSLYLDGDLMQLTDSGFQELTTVNPLLTLQELWVNVSSNLSMTAVSPLVFDSMSSLKKLGRLSCIKGVDRGQFLQLKSQVTAMNLDIELVWVTPGV